MYCPSITRWKLDSIFELLFPKPAPVQDQSPIIKFIFSLIYYSCESVNVKVVLSITSTSEMASINLA